MFIDINRILSARHSRIGHVTVLSALLIILVFATISCTNDTSNDQLTVETDKSFENVMLDLEFAITDHNFRITGRNDIGEAIAERHKIAFPRYTVVHFCNLEYARKFLEEDPHTILHMPCMIAVFEQGDKVVLKTHLLPEDDTRLGRLSAEVNTILRQNIDYAAK